MAGERFAVVEIEKLELLLSRIDNLEAEIKKLGSEKELPPELSIREASKLLGLSEKRIYNKIYTHEIKAIQRQKRGKVTIAREEIMRLKKINVKSL